MNTGGLKSRAVGLLRAKYSKLLKSSLKGTKTKKKHPLFLYNLVEEKTIPNKIRRSFMNNYTVEFCEIKREINTYSNKLISGLGNQKQSLQNR